MSETSQVFITAFNKPISQGSVWTGQDITVLAVITVAVVVLIWGIVKGVRK